MSINPILSKREARERLVERVKLAKISKDKTQTQKECDHDFETFKETIRSNTTFSRTAYFIVKGCVKCHFKFRIDYKIV